MKEPPAVACQESHSVTCYPTQVNAPCLSPISQAGNLLYLRTLEDWRPSWPGYIIYGVPAAHRQSLIKVLTRPGNFVDRSQLVTATATTVAGCCHSKQTAVCSTRRPIKKRNYADRTRGNGYDLLERFNYQLMDRNIVWWTTRLWCANAILVGLWRLCHVPFCRNLGVKVQHFPLTLVVVLTTLTLPCERDRLSRVNHAHISVKRTVTVRWYW